MCIRPLLGCKDHETRLGPDFLGRRVFSTVEFLQQVFCNL